MVQWQRGYFRLFYYSNVVNLYEQAILRQNQLKLIITSTFGNVCFSHQSMVVGAPGFPSMQHTRMVNIVKECWSTRPELVILRHLSIVERHVAKNYLKLTFCQVTLSYLLLQFFIFSGLFVLCVLHILR